MTYTEFRQAIDIAPDGGTVVLENDVEFDSALPEISKKVTIASPVGMTNTLRRASSFNGQFLNISDAAADLTFTNVTIDGGKEECAYGVSIYRSHGAADGTCCPVRAEPVESATTSASVCLARG